MKISAISSANFTRNNLQRSQNQQTFQGILKYQSSNSDEQEWHGMPSSYNIDGNYHTSSNDEYYTYYPFADEPESKIEKTIRENTYSSSSDYGGIYHTESRYTERGERLQFTEREWKALPRSTREKIERMLK